METNNIDKIIKEKLQDRTLQPSASAWERLSVQLAEQPKAKHKSVFYYVGVAASVVLLLSFGYQLFNSKNDTALPKIEEVVIAPKDKEVIKENIDKLINEIPIQEALVKQEIDKTNKETSFKINQNKKTEKKVTIPSKILIKKDENTIVKIDKSLAKNIKKSEEEHALERLEALKRNPNSSIKINADDLLYAVTHTPKEVKAYYVKYQINREDVLKSIKSELKKSNIKINPETILAEVERSIDDDDFQNNFMKNLKRRVSDIASAIASRND